MNFQPVIVTRDAQMKQVFGLGYPSRPVYTVEEFGDMQVEKMKKQALVSYMYDQLTKVIYFIDCK